MSFLLILLWLKQPHSDLEHLIFRFLDHTKLHTHTHTHTQTPGRNPINERSAPESLPTKEASNHALCGIRTRYSISQAAADLHRRPNAHRDWLNL